MLTGKENGRLDHVSYNVQHGETGTQFARQWAACVHPGTNCLGQGALTGKLSQCACSDGGGDPGTQRRPTQQYEQYERAALDWWTVNHL